MTLTSEFKGLQLGGRARIFVPLLKDHREDEIRKVAIRAPKDAAEALVQLYQAYEVIARDVADLTVSDFVRGIREESETLKTQLDEAKAQLKIANERHQHELEHERAQAGSYENVEIDRAKHQAAVAETKLATHRQERDLALQARDQYRDLLDQERQERAFIQEGIVDLYRYFGAFAVTIEPMGVDAEKAKREGAKRAKAGQAES